MKFHQICSELATIQMNGRQPPFSTPELTDYFAPLYVDLCRARLMSWQGVFMIGVNALFKYVNVGDSVRLVCDTPSVARVAVEYGHDCLWHAGTEAVRFDIERGTVKNGLVRLTVHEAAEGAPMNAAGVGFIMSTTFGEAEAAAVQSPGRRLFLFLRIRDHEREAFHRFLNALGPQTFINTWLDVAQGNERCVIVTVTHGLDQYEV